MISQIANNSKQEGRPSSRLPTFSKEWINTIRGSADFFGFNYYTSRFAAIPDQPIGENPSYQRDQNVKTIIKPEWKKSAWDAHYQVPQGLGDALRYYLLLLYITYCQAKRGEAIRQKLIVTIFGTATHSKMFSHYFVAFSHSCWSTS